MREQAPFQYGQTILLREVWQNQVLSARPEIVVQDRAKLLISYLPNGTMLKQPRTPGGSRVTPRSRNRSEWLLIDTEWGFGGRLRLVIPDTNYSMLIFFNTEDHSQRAWYINMEDPICGTALGYDYIDQLLDIIVYPDLSEWYWKDEDELEEAVSIGLISYQKALKLRVEGEKVIQWLQSGTSPFNGWENWRPDPSWQIPILPLGWDTIE